MAVMIWMTYRSCDLDHQIAQWQEKTWNKNIGVLKTSDDILPSLPIPGAGGSLRIPFLERRGFQVLVSGPDGIEDALSLPACPVQLVIVTSSSVDDADRQRLRDRFGTDNVR